MKRVIFKAFAVAGLISWNSPLLASELFKLVTTESGMHRIDYSQLVNAGPDLGDVPRRNLALTLNGEPVPLHVEGQSNGNQNRFGPGGFIEFYASKADSLYSKEQVYVLHLVSNKERAEKVIPITGVQTRLDPNKPFGQDFLYTHVEEKNNTYDFGAPSTTDPFHFGQTFSFYATPTYKFELDGVVANSTSASVEVEMYGLLDFDIEGNDHHYEILVNGNLVGDQQFDGATATTMQIDNVPVTSGENTFKYNYRSIAGVPFDRISLNKFAVTYPRVTDASAEGRLEGRFTNYQVQIRNIDENASVYRVSEDRRQVQRLTRGVEARGTGVVFSTNGEASDYVVVGSDRYHTPQVRMIPEAEDISNGQFDYLVIAHPSLMGVELEELVALRSQEYRTKVVNVEQVYAQYGYHQVGADAIEAYIQHAVRNMGVSMVMLIGSDTLDYKQHVSQSVSLIPTKYVTTPGGALTITQTPSDAAYGDINKDGTPDVPTGRISARTPAELGNVVGKILAYEAREGYVGRTVVATDKEDLGNGVSFQDDAQAMIEVIPASWSDGLRSDFLAYPDVDGAQQAHDKLINLINSGVSVVSYVGHSSQQSWAYTTPPMLRANEIAGLTNVGKPTLVTQWGCWNTYFVDLSGNTMADAFLLTKNVGAATVLGASTLTSSAGERALGIELNKRIYLKGMTIGDAVIQAKQAMAQSSDYPDIQLGWQILGDVALKVNP
ncbi:hypothetical protein GCM10008090_22530 [Arenicella chitinivorans]|uniref:Gingipain domain-containing protein n=1 Tax=Arenicella chitinivorans TaxID=1329800 RepID=A0A918RWL1_9GAMM|nr:C25 family cysteine peptidase [Arenicella chitinivorans]GHA12152.1 hypothetical protein GCM10008090_22530 [Arenicella chitinivorans]